ncbi:MAG: 23S rRNA (pseudouridine(1915)-N(3))-methyltransferase RlmH [Tenericutes bacterium]|nr:23S rRNA (pseudouridine(1915)-N(3))-methyltransferase RlmH [Mycoplasmatota bacterium]
MIKIICIGKIKEKYLTDGINDYLKRLTKYHKVELIELKDSDIKKEKEEILKVLNKDSYIISLAIEGKEYKTTELSEKIDNLLTNGKSNITFIIGGSNGIDEEIKNISNELLSFSKLTFPHGLFRLILLEQIYRIFKIQNNETYHK